MQTQNEIEDWYKTPDPWGYETNPDDQARKAAILKACSGKGYKRALDIGAGEGFITRDLQAEEVHAIEWSDTARRRIPLPVLAVTEPHGKYDLVLATGVLYGHYEIESILQTIRDHASHVLVIAGIKDWLVLDRIPEHFKITRREEFPYREYKQIVIRYES